MKLINKAYTISGKKCGRKKNGEFQCKCGKCKTESIYSEKGSLKEIIWKK